MKDVFPENHATSCAIHIQRNVLAKFGKKAALEVCKIAKCFSADKETAMFHRIARSSEDAQDYLLGINPSEWRSID